MSGVLLRQPMLAHSNVPYFDDQNEFELREYKADGRTK